MRVLLFCTVYVINIRTALFPLEMQGQGVMRVILTRICMWSGIVTTWRLGILYRILKSRDCTVLGEYNGVQKRRTIHLCNL